MKRRLSAQKHFILVRIAIYFAAVSACLAVSLLIVRNQNADLAETARNHMNFYTENHSFLSYRNAGNTNNLSFRASNHSDDLIYTSEGSLAASSVKNSSVTEDSLLYDQYIKKYMTQIRNGETVQFWIVRPTPGRHFEIAVLLTMEDGGIFCHINELYAFNQWLRTIFWVSFLLFFCCALPLSLVVRKSCAIEAIQRNYIDNITHELKSPISAVRVLTETIYDGMVTDEKEKKEYCRIMLNELDNLNHTVSEMLELSRIQNEISDCPRRSFPVSDIFDSVIHKYAAVCSDRDIHFVCELPEDSLQLYTNRDFARRILDILLDNAVKFCGKEKEIRVTAGETARQISIHVKNSGFAIPPEKQPYIFTRFYQADKSHHEKGSGLGLAIASEISACLRESLWLERSGSSGTEFAFTMQKSVHL
ncbi:MAG: HAMP domain-containing histidine kinase [Clostridiales bacterium]|nr:HAMP domain-containing histidine kinase [Clostridiales bacterium]